MNSELESRLSCRGGTKASSMPSLLSNSNKKPVSGISSKNDPMNNIHKSEGSANKKIDLLTTLTNLQILATPAYVLHLIFNLDAFVQLFARSKTTSHFSNYQCFLGFPYHLMFSCMCSTTLVHFMQVSLLSNIN